MRSSVFLFTACTLLFTACSNELSEEDARLAYVATYSALAQGSAMATTIANTTPLVAEDGVDFRNGGISPRAAAGVDFPALLHADQLGVERNFRPVCRDMLAATARVTATSSV